MNNDFKIGIASDHAGYDLKSFFISHQKSFKFVDFGTSSKDSVDYPDFTEKLAKEVSGKKLDFGVTICGSGIGVCIVANKFAHIRAALVYTVEQAKLSREHNDANVLCLGSRFLSFEEAWKIFEVWISTKFEGGRHQKRIDKIESIEQKLNL